MKKKTYFWADVLRVVAICCVVLVHSSILPILPSGFGFILVGLFVVAKTCIPLFVMLSGALLLAKEEPLILFFGKRVRRVVVPWLAWSLIILVVTVGMQFTSLQQLLSIFRSIFVGQFTFIPVLFCLYVLIPLLRVFAKKKHIRLGVYSVGVWFVGISLLPYVRNTLAFPIESGTDVVSQTIRYSGYLMLGWLITLLPHRTEYAQRAMGIFLVTTMLSTWLLVRHGSYSFEYVSYVAPLLVIQSAALFYALKYVGEKFVGRKKLKKVAANKVAFFQRTLRVVSEASYGVFLCHVLILQTVVDPVFASAGVGGGFGIIRWLSTVSLSFMCVVASQRIPYLKKIVS